MNQKCELGFGPHLTLDLSSCDKEILADREKIHSMLDRLPTMIGMHKISDPNVVYYPGKPGSFDKGGVSGFVLIAESHITIHTFVEQAHAFVDIFSCKPFDLKKTEEFFVDNLKAEKVHKNLFDRGIEFPRNVGLVKEIVAKERKGF